MKPKEKNEQHKIGKELLSSTDKTSPDKDADKTGTDTDSDKTKIVDPDKKSSDRFDKPNREKDPDRTGIDTDSDKTKKEK